MLLSSSSTSVESDRLLLLSKGEAAFVSGDENERALRILQRLSRMNLDADSNKSNADKDKISLVAPVSITTATTADAAASIATSATVSGLPPLALHLAKSNAAPPSIQLPNAKNPPLFLYYNNMGLVHLQTGRLKLSQLFLARALEESQALVNALGGPPLQYPAASSLPPTNTLSTVKRSNSNSESSPPSKSSSSASTAAPQSLSLSSLSGSSSSIASGSISASGSRSRGATADSNNDNQAVACQFLHQKQMQVFYNTALVLLQLYSARVRGSANAVSYSNFSDAEEMSLTITAVQLAIRCFRHVLNLVGVHSGFTASSVISGSTSTSAATSATTASPIPGVPHSLFIHMRLAESFILLHEVEKRKSSVESNAHPLLQVSVDHASKSTSNDSASPVPSPLDNPYALDHAVIHLQRVLLLVSNAPSNSLKTATAGAANPSENRNRFYVMHQAASSKLAYVLLQLQRPQEALDALTLLVPALSTNPPANSTAGSVSLEAELYAVESLLLLKQTDRAWNVLQTSVWPIVRSALSFAAAPSPAIIASFDEEDPSGGGVEETIQSDEETKSQSAEKEKDKGNKQQFLQVLDFIVHYKLSQQEKISDLEARSFIESVLQFFPSHPPLLQSLVFLEARSSRPTELIWLLKQKRN